MSFSVHMKDYFDTPRTLYHVDRLHAWMHGQYFPPVTVEISPTHRCNQKCIYCYTKDRAEAKSHMTGERLLDLLGGSPSAQANLQVSTIGKIVETPSGYSFSMQELHTRILFTQKMELNEKCGGMEQISKHLSNV